jgi:hypothetical protein
LTVGTFAVLWAMVRRWRPGPGQPEVPVPYAPPVPEATPGSADSQ